MPRSRTLTPRPVVRSLASIGEHLTTWRKLRGLTAEQVADRAGIARSTLSALEGGRGASLENALRVARALGVLDELVRAVDPYETDLGRARADQQLPQRVRVSRSVADLRGAHAGPGPTSEQARAAEQAREREVARLRPGVG